jgi:hypothetical protein
VTLEDLGNVGEFVAAIATLITLIYLAVQIRQNTGSVKAAAAQSVLAALNEALQSAASTPQLARVVVLGQSDYNRLSEEERLQFIVWQFGWLRIVEQAYHSHLLGHLDPRIWNGHAKHMESVVQAPVFGRWWRLRQSLFSPEFREFISGLRASASAPPAAALVEELTRDNPAV